MLFSFIQQSARTSSYGNVLYVEGRAVIIFDFSSAHEGVSNKLKSLFFHNPQKLLLAINTTRRQSQLLDLAEASRLTRAYTEATIQYSSHQMTSLSKVLVILLVFILRDGEKKRDSQHLFRSFYSRSEKMPSGTFPSACFMWFCCSIYSKTQGEKPEI